MCAHKTPSPGHLFRSRGFEEALKSSAYWHSILCLGPDLLLGYPCRQQEALGYLTEEGFVVDHGGCVAS